MKLTYVPLILLMCLLSTRLLGTNRKELAATFVNEKVKIDGNLSESFWKIAPTATAFIQTIPKPDEVSDFKTEVQIVYTNSSIIVGATMFQPRDMLSAQFTARDQLNNANVDIFSVFFDTYDDHQNGFAFKVSSVNVQQDDRMSGGQSGDNSWDAVWNSKTEIENDRWTVEIEIPFSAIRFSNAKEKAWGLNFSRVMRKKNETSYWNRINVQQNGFLAQTGLLTNLKNIKPPIRLFLFPYVSTGVYNENETASSPLQWSKSGGLDIKYGLSESFTLDMTLVPDFSQVISDNLIRNLSPFEQQLNENRPFFTEGTELFNKDDLLYTRRVGGRPSGFFDVLDKYGNNDKYEVVKYTNVSNLINAFKISGRTKNNVGIGIFNGLTKTMNAEIKDIATNQTFKEETEPLTNYNVMVFDKALKGQSSITLTNTNVWRQGDDANDANVTSLMYSQFDKTETYRLGIASKHSITQLPNKSLFGHVGIVSFAKVSGKFTFEAGVNRMSKNFDKTDLGLQFDFNQTFEFASIGYNENKPKSKRLQTYRFNVGATMSQNTTPFLTKRTEINTSYFLLFKNFWDITFYNETCPARPTDFYQLGAFNKKLKMFPYWYNGVWGSSDSRKKLFWSYSIGYGISNVRHSDYFDWNSSIRYRFSPKLEMSVDANSTRDNSNIGYAYYDEVKNEPVVGRRDVREYSGQFNVRYNINPDMNFTARFRHYNSFLNYTSFHVTDEVGEWRNSLLPYKQGMDENFNLQNIDIFYNWIFKPGSRFIVSYKQWLNNGYVLNESQGNRYFGNLRQVVQTRRPYEIALRVIYFIDYNHLKKKT